MKKNVFMIALILVCGICECIAQTTGLYTYDGGYFIKNGDQWSEYRYGRKETAWATYTQYNEDANYFNIRSSKCSLSIPKEKHYSFYILRNNSWEVIYTTREIYKYFDDDSRKIYCYQGGYFVRDGNSWREYRPEEYLGLWADYNQFDEDDNYYMIESTACKVSVPKKSNNAFYILQNGNWEKCYETTELYDRAALFDYTINFPYHKVSGSDNKWIEKDTPASISLNRNGTGELTYGDQCRAFKFNRIGIPVFKDSDTEMGLRVTINGDEEYIFFIGDWCMVNVKSICPFMNFLDCQNKSEIERIKEIVRGKNFFN